MFRVFIGKTFGKKNVVTFVTVRARGVTKNEENININRYIYKDENDRAFVLSLLHFLLLLFCLLLYERLFVVFIRSERAAAARKSALGTSKMEETVRGVYER